MVVARPMSAPMMSTCAPFERPSATPATQLILSFLVEPGGAVVCTPGYYVGRVIDVKDIVDEHYVVTELSRINIDHEMKKTSYVHEMVTGAQETLPRQIICGYTCMDSDRLFTAHDEPALRVGDAVVIRYAGAYSMSFTPQFFIEYPPAVYAMAPDGQPMLLREPWNEQPPRG